ncbi:hypothetical protein CA267_013095 [Alteromonas pelagimontana]|uniref:Uncharacterized protein n=1 Tax=Alteromonas pelagimontana TaxID=1858656 RepID=A0A6M4MEM7_9ALTE|nr:hypothetical protein [Alteromonas pelagimontana]QJR81634.1 hypothetical protein CA267_013095 [Alteromonas pelagimontana]
MALKNGKPQVGPAHLEKIALDTVPASLVALWASCYLNDAVLSRLAMAEQQQNKSNKWQHMMAQRVAMREWRNDVAPKRRLCLLPN